MKKQVTTMALIAAIVATTLTGCMRVEETMDFSEKKDTFIETETTLYNKEKIDTSEESDGSTTMNGKTPDEIKNLPIVERDGVKYYEETETTERSFKDIENDDSLNSAVVTNDSFYVIYSNTSKGNTNSEAMTKAVVAGFLEGATITLKFGDEIVETNGVLSEDKKTVVFDMYKDILTNASKTGYEYYAYTNNATHTLLEDREIIKEKTTPKVKTYNKKYCKIKETYINNKLKEVKIKAKSGCKISIKCPDGAYTIKNGKWTILNMKGKYTITTKNKVKTKKQKFTVKIV